MAEIKEELDYDGSNEVKKISKKQRTLSKKREN
jgi:hypothetical protein